MKADRDEMFSCSSTWCQNGTDSVGLPTASVVKVTLDVAELLSVPDVLLQKVTASSEAPVMLFTEPVIGGGGNHSQVRGQSRSSERTGSSRTTVQTRGGSGVTYSLITC